MRRSRQPREHPSTPPPTDESEFQAFVEQGRWLLEYHDRRSDGLNQRAVAILGFTGVLTALVPNALRIAPDPTSPGGAVQVTFWITLTLLVVTAVISLTAVQVGQTGAPGVPHLRGLLNKRLTVPRTGRVQVDIAATLLDPLHLDKLSPVDLAAAEAARRATRVKWAVRSLLAALVALAVLVAELFLQLAGR